MGLECSQKMKYPSNKSFAFSIVDDTDNSTVENVKPVYDFLTDLGFRITKTVWIYPSRDKFRGECLLDNHYLNWIRKLQIDGHEIALHNVGSGSFTRDEIVEGVRKFRELLGVAPSIHTNHVSNPDNMYWQPHHRFHPPLSWIYTIPRLLRAIGRRQKLPLCSGDDPSSIHFWGDVCFNEVKFVRNLTFSHLDTLRNDPHMPYHDPRKPFVKRWFSSSDGHTVEHFVRLLSKQNVDKLVDKGGAAIIYTHFTDGFMEKGAVRSDFAEAMKQLAARGGWFVPASEILDWLDANPAKKKPGYFYFFKLETRWLLARLLNFARFRR